MNNFMLSFMSGPIMALVRYGITAASTYALAKGIPADIVTKGAALVLAAAPAVIGAIGSTQKATVQKAANVPGVSVKLPSGKVATTSAQVHAADLATG